MQEHVRQSQIESHRFRIVCQILTTCCVIHNTLRKYSAQGDLSVEVHVLAIFAVGSLLHNLRDVQLQPGELSSFRFGLCSLTANWKPCGPWGPAVVLFVLGVGAPTFRFDFFSFRFGRTFFMLFLAARTLLMLLECHIRRKFGFGTGSVRTLLERELVYPRELWHELIMVAKRSLRLMLLGDKCCMTILVSFHLAACCCRVF